MLLHLMMHMDYGLEFQLLLLTGLITGYLFVNCSYSYSFIDQSSN